MLERLFESLRAAGPVELRPQDWLRGFQEQIEDIRARWRNIPGSNLEIAGELYREGKINEALFRLRIALWLAPNIAELHALKGACLLENDHLPEAVTCFRKALFLKPDMDEPRFLLAVHAGENPPDHAPASIIARHFENRAASYDAVMTGPMEYQGHRAVWQQMAPHLEGREGLLILDLGAGTGLAGAGFREQASYLRGVDCSEAMLRQAQAKKTPGGHALYDSLVPMELGRFLKREDAGRYDLVLAAAVFNYYGDFRPLLPDVLRVLRPGGWFCFSLEQAQNNGQELQSGQGHYRHSREFAAAALTAAGFVAQDIQETLLMQQMPGWQIAARKPV